GGTLGAGVEPVAIGSPDVGGKFCAWDRWECRGIGSRGRRVAHIYGAPATALAIPGDWNRHERPGVHFADLHADEYRVRHSSGAADVTPAFVDCFKRERTHRHAGCWATTVAQRVCDCASCSFARSRRRRRIIAQDSPVSAHGSLWLQLA